MHPESAVSDYVAHLRNQEYKPGSITGGRTGSIRFHREEPAHDAQPMCVLASARGD